MSTELPKVCPFCDEVFKYQEMIKHIGSIHLGFMPENSQHKKLEKTEENENMDQQKLEPNDKCISCLLSDFFETTSSSFTVKARRASSLESIEPELFQIAHPNKRKVDLEGKFVMEDKETNSPLIDYKFFDLLPGKQYSVKIDTKYRKQDKPVLSVIYFFHHNYLLI